MSNLLNTRWRPFDVSEKFSKLYFYFEILFTTLRTKYCSLIREETKKFTNLLDTNYHC